MSVKLYPITTLRHYLISTPWAKFMHKGLVRVRNVTFIARAGLYMGRPALAIMAQGKFVVLRFVQVSPGSTLSLELKKLQYTYTPDGRRAEKVIVPNPKMILDPLKPKQCGFDISRLVNQRIWDNTFEVAPSFHSLVIEASDEEAA